MADVAIIPSFFPTTLEIAGGIQWVKQHPVVATAAMAAATAVSVLKYLQAAAKDEPSEGQVAVLSPRSKLNATDDGCSSTESDASTPSRHQHTLSPRALCVRDCCTSVQGSAEMEAAVGNCAGDAAWQEEEEAEGETGSPQWGWYVSTTPPEDYYP